MTIGPDKIDKEFQRKYNSTSDPKEREILGLIYRCKKQEAKSEEFRKKYPSREDTELKKLEEVYSTVKTPRTITSVYDARTKTEKEKEIASYIPIKTREARDTLWKTEEKKNIAKYTAKTPFGISDAYKF